MTCCLCLPPVGMMTHKEKEPLVLTVNTALLPMVHAVRIPQGGFRKIDWGDGTVTGSGIRSHTYADPGTYQVKIWANDGTRLIIEAKNLVSLDAWGDALLRGISFAGGSGVYSTPHFESVPDYLPPSITTMERMFAYATVFNDANVGLWDTANVTNYEYCFYEARDFNQPLTNWNTSNATTFRGMFRGARAFDQSLAHFETSNVIAMDYMFYGAVSFNGDLSGFDTSVVTTMAYMFRGASVFNKPLSHFDTGEVVTFESMFYSALEFAQEVSTFNTGKAVNMNRMFFAAGAFNDDLSGWCVALITSTPVDFASGASAWILPKPVWGTCP